MSLTDRRVLTLLETIPTQAQRSRELLLDAMTTRLFREHLARLNRETRHVRATKEAPHAQR